MARYPTASWRDTTVAVNPHVSMALGELADGWAGHVMRLAAELDTPSDDKSVWGVYDYVAALTLRESFELGLTVLVGDDWTEALRGVADADRLFEEFTEPDLAGLLSDLRPSKVQSGSWWHRVPKRGPVRVELGQGRWFVE